MDVRLLLLLPGLCLPLKQLHVNSGFGVRAHPIDRTYRFHTGVDLAANSDTVFAIADGIVEATGFDSHLGRFVKIRHGHLESTYGHLSVIGVRTNDSVSCAEPIGISGATGRVTGEHLHFAISYQHHFIDPLAFLSGWLHQFYTNKHHEKIHERTDR